MSKRVEEILTRLENQTGKRVKKVRTDRGRKYLNGTLKGVFNSKGIVHKTTTNTPRSKTVRSGATECWRSGRGLCLLKLASDKSFGRKPWDGQLPRNRTTSSVHGRTPFEVFTGEKPDLSHLRVFGAKAFMHVPKEIRKKMEPVSETGYFVGYEPDSKSYRVLPDKDGRIIVSRDVIVDEGARRPSEVVVEIGEDDDLTAKPVESVPESEEALVYDTAGRQTTEAKEDGRSLPWSAAKALTLPEIPVSGQKEPTKNPSQNPSQAPGNDEDVSLSGDQADARRRFPARERKRPGEWYK